MKYTLTALALLLSGCASMVLPPKAPGSTLKIDRPIYVESYQHPIYSESLRAALEGTDIFTEVIAAEPKGAAAYSARVNRRIHGNAVIPFLTFVSLGIIPTITEEECGESFILLHKGKKHRIEATWKGRTVLGWAALFMNLSPNRTSGNPDEHPRFKSFLRSKIQKSIGDSHNMPDSTDGYPIRAQ